MLASFYDIPFDRSFSDDELINVTSKVFEVDRHKIVVRYHKEDWSQVKDDTVAICTVIQKQTAFPTRIDISCLGYPTHYENEIETIGRLCDTLKCRALVKTKDSNPFIFFEISGLDKHREVTIDIDRSSEGQ